MLQIYAVVLDVIVTLRPVMAVFDRKDRDLGRQLRRCSQSAGLNLAEGMYSRGRNRAAKYHVALGSAREMLACLELAEAPSPGPQGRSVQNPRDERGRRSGHAGR